MHQYDAFKQEWSKVQKPKHKSSQWRYMEQRLLPPAKPEANPDTLRTGQGLAIVLRSLT